MLLRATLPVFVVALPRPQTSQRSNADVSFQLLVAPKVGLVGDTYSSIRTVVLYSHFYHGFL